MIDENSMNRIIGDFFELNASILEKREKSKLPKFLSRYIWKKNIRNIFKNIELLRNSDYVLNLFNITELATYIFNNFDDKKYKSIKLIKLTKLINYNSISIVIKFDNIQALIEFVENSTSFDLKITSKDNKEQTSTFNYTLNRLENSRNNLVNILNKELRNVLCDYIYDSISLYE